MLTARMKNELNTVAETIMMGYTHQCGCSTQESNKAVCKYIANYIRGVAAKNNAEDLDALIDKLLSKPERMIRAINVSKLEDMVLLTFVMTTEEDDEGSFDLCSPDGVFGYCVNLTYPDCSEYGYSYYEHAMNRIVRIG